MIPVPTSTPELTDESVRAATGRSWEEWFSYLDERGGPSQGRRQIGVHLNYDLKIDAWWCAVINVQYEAARGVVERDGRPKGYMVCATKTVNAPVERAWEAFANAEALGGWFGSGVELDFREGGRFANADGDAGQISKIRPNKAIRFTWEQPRHTPGTVVETTFQPRGEKCVVMVAHDRIQTAAEADELRATWGAALDRLKKQLESAWRS
jgi:uncharacterized protein YndB with AHSA1/START domain